MHDNFNDTLSKAEGLRMSAPSPSERAGERLFASSTHYFYLALPIV